MDETQALIKIDEAQRMLAEARELTEIIEIRDRARAMHAYAVAKGSNQAANTAKEIQLRAERAAGEFLQEMDKATGGQPYQATGNKLLPVAQTYAELGIQKMVASRWQKIAKLPEPVFERHIAEHRTPEQELTAAGMLRVAKEYTREEKRERNRELVEGTADPMLAADGQTFQTIVLDPPWDWGDEGDIDQFGRARPTYATMPIEEIANLPVANLATENAHIYLWITNRSLPKGFGLLEGWDFRYVTMLTWCKPHFGMGNYFRGSTEHILFGVRGSLSLLRQDVGTWFKAARPGQHSSKPLEFYELVESCSPGPWLEMFSRGERPGWFMWGAEVG